MGETLDWIEQHGEEPGGIIVTLGWECSECGWEYQSEGCCKNHILKKHKRGYIKHNQMDSDGDEWYYKIKVPRRKNVPRK